MRLAKRDITVDLYCSRNIDRQLRRSCLERQCQQKRWKGADHTNEALQIATCSQLKTNIDHLHREYKLLDVEEHSTRSVT